MSREVPLDEQIRNTTKNVAILVAHVHHLRSEVREMREQFEKVSGAIFKLLHDPQSQHQHDATDRDSRKTNLE